MTALHRSFVLAIALGIVVGRTAVSAQDVTPIADPPATSPDANTLEAQSLFAQGVALAGEERWGDAIAYFRRSRALVERPGTVFNIAVGLVRLGRATEALEALDDFLRISDATSDAERRSEAQRMQELVRATVAELIVELAPPDARLVVDETERPQRGRVHTMAVDPGRHTLRVSAPDHADARLYVSVLPGETKPITVRLTPTTGRLVVFATPADVHLHVDGSIVDTTRNGDGSLTVSLAPGRHHVRVGADRREPTEIDVTLRAGARTTVRTDLAPERATLLESPFFWIVAGVFAASAGVAIGIVSSGTEAPYTGSTGIVLGD